MKDECSRGRVGPAVSVGCRSGRDGHRRCVGRVEEVAELLGVATGTLYNWRYRGEGPKSVRAGKRVRYRYADIVKKEENRNV